MYIIFFVGLFIYFSKEIAGLNRRLTELEKNNTTLESLQKRETPDTTPSQQKPKKSTVLTSEKKQSQITSDSASDMLTRFGDWYKVDWMLKTGVLFLLCGLGWFVTYAFMNNWIGQSGRITLGYFVGVALLVYGWIKMHEESFAKKAAAFFVLGASTIMLTTYAAHMMYNMFPATVAMGIMYLTSSFVSVCSIRFVKSLDIIGLALAACAPLLVQGNEGATLLFVYLFVVVLGSHVVVHVTGRREVIFAGLIMVSLYSAPYILSKPFLMHQNDYGVLLIFAYAFTAIFFLASIVGILRSSSNESYKASSADIATACGTGLFLLTWVTTAAPKDWQSIILIAWMLVFSVGAFLVFKKTNKKEPFYGYAIISLVLLGTATAIEFKEQVLLIAFILEATAIVLSSDILLRSKAITKVTSFAFVVPIIFSMNYIFEKSSNVSILLLAIALLGVAFKMYRNERDHEEKQYGLFKLFLISGSIYFWIYIWNFIHSLTTDVNGTIITLIIYTIAGLFIYIYGVREESRGSRLYGSILIGFAIARIIIIDVWSMELFGKVIVFIVVGALLMSTAFIGKKKNGVLN